MKPARGKELKEIGQAIALENAGAEWVDQMLATYLPAFIKVRRKMGLRTFKTEDFREVAEDRDWPMPKSPNAWGAFTNAACKAGIIVWTGDYEAAESAATHSHPVKVWRAA